MNFGQAVSSVLGRYFQFSGRGQRSEYWYYVLFFYLTLTGGAVIAGGLSAVSNASGQVAGIGVAVGGLVLSLPLVSAMWRRCQDVGVNGWWSLCWIFFAVLAVVALAVSGVNPESLSRDLGGRRPQLPSEAYPAVLLWLIAIMFYMVNTLIRLWPSQPGENRHGPEPKIGGQEPLGPLPTRRMSMIEAVFSVFSKYVRFSGRARLPELMWFYAFNAIVMFVLVLTSLLFGEIGVAIAGGAALLYFAGILLPSLALVWRRLHDVGRSGWWYGAYILTAVAVVALAAALGLANAGGPQAFERMLAQNIVLLGLGVVAYIAFYVLGIAATAMIISRSEPGPNAYGPEPGR